MPCGVSRHSKFRALTIYIYAPVLPSAGSSPIWLVQLYTTRKEHTMRTLTGYIHDHPLPPVEWSVLYAGVYNTQVAMHAHYHDHARTLEWRTLGVWPLPSMVRPTPWGGYPCTSETCNWYIYIMYVYSNEWCPQELQTLANTGKSRLFVQWSTFMFRCTCTLP